MSNWFVLAVGILQLSGSCTYFIHGKKMFALLMFLYALTNFVLFSMEGE